MPTFANSRSLITGHVVVGLLAMLVLHAAFAADPLAVKFKGVKARITGELRANNPDIRAAALEKLAEYPTPDAAALLLQQGSLTPFADVRRGCFHLLRTFANHEEVATVLQADVLNKLRLNKADATTSVSAVALFSADKPAVIELLPKIVEQAEKTAAGLQLMAGIVDEMSELGDVPSKKSLVRLVEQSLFNTHYGLRRALVQALCKINEKEAVSGLMQFFPTAEGETRADIERRMLQISGLKPEDRTDWLTWWQEKEKEFVFPAGLPRDPVLALRAGAPSYYGLPLYGSKIIFIADFSGSMRGPKLAAAQRELTATIGQLPDGVKFNIIAFNSEVFRWKRELQLVSPQSKLEATRFIASGQAAATTASFDALEAALEQDTDSIYFLTDGAPVGGKTQIPAEIITIISRTNRVRRATINAIGIGVGAPGNAFDTFLSELSSKNFGAYRRID